MVNIEHAKKHLKARGFDVEHQVPVLASLLQFLALHPKIFGSENVDLNTMQSVLRENGFRLDDADPVLLMLALNDIVLTDAKTKLSVDGADSPLNASPPENDAPSLMTEKEFRSIVIRFGICEISESSWAACHDVLVNGDSALSAARKQHTVPAQIERYLRKIEAKIAHEKYELSLLSKP